MEGLGFCPQMRTVSGVAVSSKPISLSKAASVLSKFTSAETGSSPEVTVYLHRTLDAFNELKLLHREFKSSTYGHKHEKHHKSYDEPVEAEETHREDAPSAFNELEQLHKELKGSRSKEKCKKSSNIYVDQVEREKKHTKDAPPSLGAQNFGLSSYDKNIYDQVNKKKEKKKKKKRSSFDDIRGEGWIEVKEREGGGEVGTQQEIEKDREELNGGDIEIRDEKSFQIRRKKEEKKRKGKMETKGAFDDLGGEDRVEAGKDEAEVHFKLAREGQKKRENKEVNAEGLDSVGGRSGSMKSGHWVEVAETAVWSGFGTEQEMEKKQEKMKKKKKRNREDEGGDATGVEQERKKDGKEKEKEKRKKKRKNGENKEAGLADLEEQSRLETIRHQLGVKETEEALGIEPGHKKERKKRKHEESKDEGLKDLDQQSGSTKMKKRRKLEGDS